MYERLCKVQPSETGGDGKLKIRKLFDYFQDTAAMAVEPVEGGTLKLLERGYGWILINYSLNVSRCPLMDEPFRIKTWHMTGTGLYTLRAFNVLSAREEILAEAKSSWILMDLANEKPVRAIQHLPQEFIDSGEPVEPGFDKAENVTEPASVHRFPVRWHDIDANQHVNNSVYIEWAMESMPAKVLTEMSLAGLNVEYRNSLFYGETALVGIQERPSSTGRRFVCRVDPESGNGEAQAKPLCKLELHWY
jgi:medium-chain acyl-[acyl-carrier-protein] hydrolase